MIRAKLNITRFINCFIKELAPNANNAVPRGKSSHFLKPLLSLLRVRAKSGLSHMMMVHTQATLLNPLFSLLRVDCRKGAQYILGTAPTFPLFCPSPAF
jgi:hypothetical protein